MRTTSSKMKMESFKLSQEESDALNAAADKAQLSRSEFIRRTLRTVTGLPAGGPARSVMPRVDSSSSYPTWSVLPALLRVHSELKDLLREIAEGLAAVPTGQPVDLATLHCLLVIIDYHLDESLDTHVGRWMDTAEVAGFDPGVQLIDGGDAP